MSVQANWGAIKHRAADSRDGALDRPTERVEAGNGDRVGRGRDDRTAAEHIGELLRQLVGAACMAAEQGHRILLRLVHAHHAGVGVLVGQQRGICDGAAQPCQTCRGVFDDVARHQTRFARCSTQARWAPS